MNSKYTLFIAVLCALGMNVTAHAVPIAIIDSGTDLNHKDLQAVQWTNAGDEDDAVDNDDNGYIDDTHGWNFAENNNKLFDKRLLGTFSPDVRTFFEYQLHMLNGVATADELAWIDAHKKDPAFIAELNTYGNFVHGSHVAGIASKDSKDAQIMGIKLIPTKQPKPFAVIESNGMVRAAQRGRGEETKKKLVLKAIEFLGKQQSQVFGPISTYVKDQGARVANCSFGTSHAAAKMLLGPLLKLIFKRDMSEVELNEYAAFFIDAILKGSQDAFIAPAPNTLFVIAAGNDGTSNDEFPASPANIKADNTITVAATNGLSKIASFSNFGTQMVDVAAPGVGIESTIPGNEYLVVSGTSQASPRVANVAGQILDMNPELTPGQVKQILMETSDKKAFLADKVKSGGIVNLNRAVMAAKYSRGSSLTDAIARSVQDVRDQKETKSIAASSAAEFALPLPSVF